MAQPKMIETEKELSTMKKSNNFHAHLTCINEPMYSIDGPDVDGHLWWSKAFPRSSQELNLGPSVEVSTY